MNEVGDRIPEHEYARNGYDMSSDEVQLLCRQLLEQQPPTASDRYICYEMDGDDVFADIGRFVERVRFEEAFNNDASEMHREYGPYEKASTFFISLDSERCAPTGALRIIRNSSAGLKTLNDVSIPPLSLDIEEVQARHGIASLNDCWDIGTVAAMHGYPPGTASIQLYRCGYMAAMRENVQHVVSIIDTDVLPKLSDSLGFPFMPLVGTAPFEYLGSAKSQAVYGYVPDFYQKITETQKRSAHGRLAEKILERLLDGSEDRAYISKRL